MERNVLIFGGSSNIGSAIINELTTDYNIYFTYFSNKNTSKKITCEKFYCDFRNLENILDVVKNVPSLDLVVTSGFPFIKSKAQDFDKYLETEKYLQGHVFLISSLINKNKMRKNSKIIDILGQCAERGFKEGVYYAASFSFLNNLSKSINSSKEYNFSICDVLLGAVDTKIWEEVPKDIRERYSQRGKFVSTNEVAKYVKNIALSENVPTKFVLDGFYSIS